MRSINCPESTADGAKSPTNCSARNIVRDVKSKRRLLWHLEDSKVNSIYFDFFGAHFVPITVSFFTFSNSECACAFFSEVYSVTIRTGQKEVMRDPSRWGMTIQTFLCHQYFSISYVWISNPYSWYGWLPWVTVELIPQIFLRKILRASPSSKP